MKNTERKKGFTLIELLVVITIIGILAGIAFVGFGDVFSTAGRTTAQKNLKTVYEALAAKTRSFPMTGSSSLDEASVEGFIVWWRKKPTIPVLNFGSSEKTKKSRTCRVTNLDQVYPRIFPMRLVSKENKRKPSVIA